MGWQWFIRWFRKGDQPFNQGLWEWWKHFSRRLNKEQKYDFHLWRSRHLNHEKGNIKTILLLKYIFSWNFPSIYLIMMTNNFSLFGCFDCLKLWILQLSIFWFISSNWTSSSKRLCFGATSWVWLSCSLSKFKFLGELFEDDEDELERKEMREKEHSKCDIMKSSFSIFTFMWFHSNASIRLYVTKFLGSERIKLLTLFFFNTNNMVWTLLL